MKVDPAEKERWLREFRINGFVILRDFLPKEWVVAVHDQLLPILRGELERDEKGQARTRRAVRRLAFDVGRYAELLQGPLAHERYMRNPVIEELVDEILGPDSWRRGWSQVECVWNGSEHMDWHSDQTLEETPDLERQDRTVRVTYNIPLVDFTWANGAMELIPGTQLLPRSFLATSFNEVPHLYPAALRLQRGDALLRDGNTMHRGTPNLTDHPRPMLDQTYKSRRSENQGS